MSGSSDINWTTLRERLSRASEQEITEQELERIFQQRAESLARQSSDERKIVGSDVFRFALGAAKFAVELKYVRTIITPRWVTRIPHAPAHLAQLTHVGGRVVSLLRLDKFMDVPGVSTAPSQYLLLEHQGIRLGVAATELSGIAQIDLNDLNPAGQNTGGDLLKGVGNDMTLVLDGARTILDLRVEVGRADQG
jgi:purine-binding chemotaxis protein CheW